MSSLSYIIIKLSNAKVKENFENNKKKKQLMKKELIVTISRFPSKTPAGQNRVGQHSQRNNPAIYGA